jgi:hypothetical protein
LGIHAELNCDSPSSVVVYTGIRVVVIDSIPLCGTGRVDTTTLGIGSVDTDTHTDIDVDKFLASEEYVERKKNRSAQPQTRRVASTPIVTGPRPVAVDRETALELLMLGHPLGMHT